LIVDVSASTEAFLETVCLIAVRRSFSGRTDCRRCGKVGTTLVCVHRRVLLLPDVYGLLDPSIHLDRPFRGRLQSKPKRQQSTLTK